MNIEKAREFIYRNARPLDFARWRYLFEGGQKEDVLRILATYQNEDGGFGHGLEADCLNPDSSPIQTWTATEILREVGLCDAEHPIVRGILRYLASGKDFDGHLWSNAIPSNNDYPHAPWWNYVPEQAYSYNPTASLVGFILRYEKPSGTLYADALRLAREAWDFFRANYPLDSMHTVFCFVELFDDLRESGRDAGIDMKEFEDLLTRQIGQVLTADTSVWATEYVCKPSLFIASRDSVFYPEYQTLCDFECDFLSKTQEADGTWAVTWEWDSYPEDWHICKNRWKSDLILKNVKFYRAMRG